MNVQRALTELTSSHTCRRFTCSGARCDSDEAISEEWQWRCVGVWESL